MTEALLEGYRTKKLCSSEIPVKAASLSETISPPARPPPTYVGLYGGGLSNCVVTYTGWAKNQPLENGQKIYHPRATFIMHKT